MKTLFCLIAFSLCLSSGVSAGWDEDEFAPEVHSVHAQRTAAELRALALYGGRTAHVSGDRELSPIWSIRGRAGTLQETGRSTSPLHRQVEDPWFGFDKVQHFTFSFLWTLGTQYVVVNKGKLSEARALPISISTSAAVGFSKELYDLQSGPQGFFSYRDLVANGLGILLATGLILF